jgi:hypothetical protein
MTDMAVINFPRKYAFFAENGPIEKTVTSYKNHEFIPPGRKTTQFYGMFLGVAEERKKFPPLS